MRQQGLQLLIGDPSSGSEVHPVEVVLGLSVSQAKYDHHTSSTQMVERDQVFGQANRVIEGEHRNRNGDLGPFGHRGHCGRNL